MASKLLYDATNMSLPKTLLVPTDFGESSEVAAAYAVELAQAFGASVVLVHTYEIPMVGFPDGTLIATAELATRVLDGAQEGVNRAVAAHASSGVSIRGIVKQGETWRTILETADEVGAGMIVMGTHGRKGLPRALLGSVAEKIVRMSHVPVVTVRQSGPA